jgi:hypothetical protein
MKLNSKYKLKAYQLKLDDFLLFKLPEKMTQASLKLKSVNKVNIAFKA